MAGASMSSEFHHRDVYSLSDEFERHEANQTHHKPQTLSSQMGKLRVRGFEPTTAESAASVLAVAGHLLPIEAEEDRDATAVYASSSASNTISVMFNFSNTAELIDCQNPNGYHRLQQQLPPITSKWYAGDRHGMVQLNPGNMTSLHEASEADSPTAIQLFLMNPQSASTASVVDGPQAQQCQRTFSTSLPPMGAMTEAVSSLHPHHPVHHSQAFLGSAYASIGEAAGLGVGHVIENQGLSLSLSSSLKHFELAKAEEQLRIRPEGLLFNVNSTHEQQEQHPNHHQPPHLPSHDRYGSHALAGPNLHLSYSTMGTVNLLRTSKYTWAAQELLEEFCNLRTNKTGRNFPNPNPSHGGGRASTSTTVASSSSLQDFTPLSAADRFENQRKKSKLLSMLDEVDRRYDHYCEEMQMVVNSFDTVIGLGAAAPYTALAKKAMSRHFRCLKDAVASQLKRTCELLGEKDAGIVSGLTKGETPRLRLIDQSLRQHRAFQQTRMMDQEAWRPQSGLPDRSVNILRAWLFEHFLHPYPSDADKHLLARQAGLSRNQVSNWFINARVRLWKPMVEEMYLREAEDEAELQPKDEETNSQMLAVATTQLTQQQKQPKYAQQSPEYDAPESDHSAAHVPMSQVIMSSLFRSSHQPPHASAGDLPRTPRRRNLS